METNTFIKVVLEGDVPESVVAEALAEALEMRRRRKELVQTFIAGFLAERGVNQNEAGGDNRMRVSPLSNFQVLDLWTEFRGGQTTETKEACGHISNSFVLKMWKESVTRFYKKKQSEKGCSVCGVRK
jgi:hypothetical protein